MKWKTKQLGELAVSKGGSVNPEKHPTEEFDLYSIPAFDKGEPEVIRGRAIGSSKKIVEPSDVLLSRIVPHIRRAWIVGEDRGRRLIGSGEWIQFRSSEVLPEYLRNFLLSDPFHRQFMQTVSGVGGSLLRARPAQVYEIHIPLPPLDEQKRIAAILDAADELRAKRRESLAQLDALLQSTFLDLFGDPVTNPKGWEASTLGDMAMVERGRFSPRPRNDPSFYHGKHPFIQTGDIANSGGYITSWNQTLNDRGTKVSKCFYPGTIVMAIVGATIGRTAILKIPAYCPDSVVGITTHKGDVDPAYLERFLRFRRNDLFERAPQTARANLNLEILRPFPVLNPPVKLQKRYSDVVNQVESLRRKYEEQLAEIDDLFFSLQSRAFRGEL